MTVMLPSLTASRHSFARHWKVTIVYGALTAAAALLLIVFARDGETTFGLSTGSDAVQLAPFVVSARTAGAVSAVILAALTALSASLVAKSRRVPAWLHAVFAVVLLFGLLSWSAAGATLPVPGLLVGAVSLSVPLVFGGLGGVISERVGVINVAIEGQLLAGAFTAAVVASISHNPYAGLIAAAIAGAAASAALALFSIRYWVDQVIVGIVMNVLIGGLTTFLFVKVLSPDADTLNSPPRFPAIDIPVLSQIPLLGPALFRQSLVVYLLYVAVAAVTWAMFSTRWGLRMRAVGEHPEAADTAGVHVNRIRTWTVLLAGAIVGTGGAYFTLGSIGSFQKEMTAGMGYIALAAVIFGRWHPLRTALVALLFGFATNLQYVLGIIGSPVPSEFLLILPYAATILAVVGFASQVKGPAAAGKPYASR